MERTMKQCFLLIVTVILVASILPAAGCTDTTDTATYSSDDVLASFIILAEERTLEDAARQEICRWWSPQIILGSVKYLEYGEVYEIEFPDMSFESTEVWAIDMKNSEIWPVKSGAYMMAVTLFCQGRDDSSTDCQLWFSQLDTLLEGMGK